MLISKFIDKFKFFNHAKISYIFSILLFFSLFREIRSRNYQFINLAYDIGNFALYLCILLLVIVFFIFVKKKKFPIILIVAHSIFYFLLIFLLEDNFSNLDINYILKRNFQLFILIFTFFIALKTEIDLNINKILKYTFLYIILLFLLSLLESNSLRLDFSFESISRINVISYFVLILFSFSLLQSEKPKKLIILFSSIMMIAFASKFFFFYLLILMFFYYLNSIKKNRFYVKSIWFFLVLVNIVFYTTIIADINKISKIINLPVGNFLKLNTETKLYAYDGNRTTKINILKYKETIGNTVHTNQKRFIYSKLYSDLYTGLMTRILLNKYYLEKFFLNKRILTNDDIVIRIETHSIYLPDKDMIEKLPMSRISIDYKLSAPPLYKAKINYNKVTKDLNKIGIDNFLSLCLINFPGIRACMEDVIEKNYQYEEHNFKRISSSKIFSAAKLEYASGYNLRIFSSHNSFINFISNFSYLGFIYIIFMIFLISVYIFKNKFSSNFILTILFMLIIHSAEDYLFSNAFQVSILSFFILGKLIKSNLNR